MYGVSLFGRRCLELCSYHEIDQEERARWHGISTVSTFPLAAMEALVDEFRYLVRTTAYLPERRTDGLSRNNKGMVCRIVPRVSTRGPF